MFEQELTVKIHDTDATGVIFFAHQFRWAHDVCEAFMNEQGYDFEYLVKKASFFLPMVHADADYYAPLRAGDRLIASMTIERMGKTSFTYHCLFKRPNGEKVGCVRHTHVSVDKETREKIPLPDVVRKVLEKHLIRRPQS